jgi:hypothetical protein
MRDRESEGERALRVFVESSCWTLRRSFFRTSAGPFLVFSFVRPARGRVIFYLNRGKLVQMSVRVSISSFCISRTHTVIIDWLFAHIDGGDMARLTSRQDGSEPCKQPWPWHALSRQHGHGKQQKHATKTCDIWDCDIFLCSMSHVIR